MLNFNKLKTNSETVKKAITNKNNEFISQKFQHPQTCICSGKNGRIENVVIKDIEDIDFYKIHFFDNEEFEIEIRI
jgi:hypothetical protein